MLIMRPTLATLALFLSATLAAPVPLPSHADVEELRALDALAVVPKVDDLMRRAAPDASDASFTPASVPLHVLESGAGWAVVVQPRPRGCRLFLCL